MSYCVQLPSTASAAFSSSSRFVRAAACSGKPVVNVIVAAAALALVEAHDDAVAVLGPLDRLDDDVGRVQATSDAGHRSLRPRPSPLLTQSSGSFSA